MKNWEAYENKIKEVDYNFALTKDNKLDSCKSLECRHCKFSNYYNKNDRVCRIRQINWLYQEYQKPKIKISRATKIILESFDECWNWITKDKDGSVLAYVDKPYKEEEAWANTNGRWHYLSSLFKENLFEFLSWEDKEPTNIKELLENCEVIEDE